MFYNDYRSGQKNVPDFGVKNHISQIQKFVEAIWTEVFEGNLSSIKYKNLSYFKNNITNFKNIKKNTEDVMNWIISMYPSPYPKLIENNNFTDPQKQLIINYCSKFKPFPSEIPFIIHHFQSSNQFTTNPGLCFDLLNNYTVDLKKLHTFLFNRDNYILYEHIIIIIPPSVTVDSNVSLKSEKQKFQKYWPVNMKTYVIKRENITVDTDIIKISYPFFEFTRKRVLEENIQIQFIDDYFLYYFDHTYIINLKKRKDKLLSLLQKYPSYLPKPNIFEAVDPIENINYVKLYDEYNNNSLIDIADLEKHENLNTHPRLRYRKLSEGEYGIFQSNVGILKNAIEKNFNYLFLLEDDARFHVDFQNKWKDVCPKFPVDWKIILLGSKNLHPPFSTEHGFHNINMLTCGWHSVLFSREGMIMFYEFIRNRPFLPIDEIIKRAMIYLADFKTYVCDESLIITLCNKDTVSDVQPLIKHSADTYDKFNWNKIDYLL
jgi:GR25 family glycosyltransferase involved in LPS biosynthesis